MDTKVTGLFPNRRMANRAVAGLVAAGLQPEHVRLIDASTPDRHAFIDDRSSDAKRGAKLGLAYGLAGAAVLAAVVGGVYGHYVVALLGGPIVTATGAVLGFWIGTTTTSQVNAEMEADVDGGTVLVGVTTDRAHRAVVAGALAEYGGTTMISTPAGFLVGSDSKPS